jgi:AGZA family xanthine/uracil permease-like MFS transporter
MTTLDRFFGISSSGSTVRREVTGGITTFATMSYIVFVQPTVLAMAGMDFGAVLVATCVSSALGCVFMGLIARYPFALAPGMGENFLFSFTVCLGMGFSWQAGLAIVFLSGVLFLFLSLFHTREMIMAVLPDCLKNVIGPAIGLLIAFIGLQWSGVIVSNPATMVSMGSLKHGAPLIALFGVLFITTLMARGARGAILLGLLACTGLGLLTGVIPAKMEHTQLSMSTFFQLDFAPLWQRWDDALVAILLFFFLDLFDTVGTLVGVSNQAGFMKQGKLPRAGRAFIADALATCTGALCGTSTVTSYVESAAGVAAGARTGLAALVTAACFIAALAMAPVVSIAGHNAGPAYYEALGIKGSLVSMYPAVAPALIVVGFLMLAPLRKIAWEDVTESFPAFATLAMMAFGYGITEGISAGCIAFAAIKLTTGRGREVHPVMYVIAAALAARYAFLT